MVNYILEISLWMIFFIFLIYVLIVKKKLGHKSRAVKDTTKYRPYVFHYEEEGVIFTIGKSRIINIFLVINIIESLIII